LHEKNNRESGISDFAVDIALLEQEKSTYLNQIEAQKKLKIGAEGILTQYDTPEEIKENGMAYNGAKNNLVATTKEIARLENEILRVDRERGKQVKAASKAGVSIKEADTMNDLVARTLGVDVGLFALIMQLIPALLLDIVSVVCLYIALYLQTIIRRKK
jgi:hypothetical protein